MAKPYRIPDFRKLYPGASEEIIAVLRTTERKMQYQEYDLKAVRTVINQKDCVVEQIPSREDSYERLMEQNVQFTEAVASTEELVLKSLEAEQLHRALTFLPDDERDLIDRIFFQEQTEREVAAVYSVSQKAINKRKQKILGKLRELLKNF